MNFKTVCLLLGMCHAGAAAALGLGELTVQSSLGQPLHATVRILGATDKTEADCFSVRPSPDSAVPPPARVRLTLERRGDHALLHLRTPGTLNDPVAQFTLTSDCEARLQRDYVVLLDPPSARASNPPVAAPDESATRTPRAPATQAAPPPRPKQASPREARPRAANRAANSASAAPRASTPAQADAPKAGARLVLSGRHGVAADALSLRLDTSLPDLNRPRPDNLTPDELSDENTALTRKLAHLEAQLQELSRRNAELETRRGAPSTARAPLSDTDLPPRWPVYALLVALALAAAFLAVFLRRRRAAGTGWVAADAVGARADADADARMEDDAWTTRPHSAESNAGAATATSGAAPDARSEPIVDFGPSTMAETTEVNDDILDQAEVYVAHGHGELAIHLLEEHLRAAPDESPVPWLLLLDLLQREGETARYATASVECRRHFNINLTLPTAGAEHDGLGIEAYPHILEQLIQIWGTEDADAFFDDLIFDRRGGTRIGFEPGAYREILLLRTISQAR